MRPLARAKLVNSAQLRVTFNRIIELGLRADVRFDPDVAMGQQVQTSTYLLNHFVCAGEEGFRNRNAERFGRLQVDVQIKLGGLLHR